MSTSSLPPDDPKNVKISVNTPKKDAAKVSVDTPVAPIPPAPITVTQQSKQPEDEAGEEQPQTERVRKHALPIGPKEGEDSFKFTLRMLFQLLSSTGVSAGALAICAAGVVVAAIGKISGNEKLLNRGSSMAIAGVQAFLEEHSENYHRFMGEEVPKEQTPTSEKDPKLKDRQQNAEVSTVKLKENQVGETHQTPQYDSFIESEGSKKESSQSLTAEHDVDAEVTPEPTSSDGATKLKSPGHSKKD